MRERVLRRYLAAYGIDSPPRTEPDRAATSDAIADALIQIARTKPHASRVHVIGVPPEPRKIDELREGVRRLARAGVAVTWSTPPFEPGLTPPWDGVAVPPADPSDDPPVAPPPARGDAAEAAGRALSVRARVAHARGEAELRRIGVKILRPRPRQHHVDPGEGGDAVAPGPA